MDRLIRLYYQSAFHIPIIPGLPAIPWKAGWWVLILLHHLAGWALLLGIWPRCAAGFLAASGAYVFLLEAENFSHNTWFHLLLLGLLVFAGDRLSLSQLIGETGGRRRCPAWPEKLLRLQVAILFFYSALDKVMSPFWGLSGGVLADRVFVQRTAPLSWIHDRIRWLVDTFPGPVSVTTIGLEFALTACMLFRPLWSIAVPLALVFAAQIEFLLIPGAFAWDVAALTVLFLPAADQRHIVLYEETCPWCRWQKAVLSRLDWLRRLRWVPLSESPLTLAGKIVLFKRRTDADPCIIAPSSRVYSGFRALRLLVLLLPGPLFVFMAVLRFGGFGGIFFGSVPADDMMFLSLFALICLWLPGVMPLLSWLLYRPLSRGFYSFPEIASPGEKVANTCPLHRLRRGVVKTD
jgi:hypothetical protein